MEKNADKETVELISDFKNLEEDYNKKRKELLVKHPNIELVAYPVTHRLFKGEKGWGALSFVGYDRETKTKVF